MRKKRVFALLLLALPTCALPVTEGVVEEAPAVEMEFYTDAGSGQIDSACV